MVVRVNRQRISLAINRHLKKKNLPIDQTIITHIATIRKPLLSTAAATAAAGITEFVVELLPTALRLPHAVVLHLFQHILILFREFSGGRVDHDTL